MVHTNQRIMSGMLAVIASSLISGAVLAADKAVGSLSPQDKNFMVEAAHAGHAEVVTGQLAAANGGHADVKKYGEHMKADHSKANDELKAIARAKSVVLPEAPDRSHQRMAKQLQNMTGDKFDRVYVREAAVKDHTSTVALFTRQTQKGTDPDVKAYAQKTLPTLQAHLKEAQALYDTVINKK